MLVIGCRGALIPARWDEVFTENRFRRDGRLVGDTRLHRDHESRSILDSRITQRPAEYRG